MAESEFGGYVQLPTDCVTMCAESLGITQLAQDVVPALAEDVNYRVREATQNAIQFMRHAKRRKLMTDDFDKALYWSNVEPLYGFGGEPPVFNAIHESGLYSVEDKEVNMREMAFVDSLDELNTSSTANGPQLSGRWISIENHSLSSEKGGEQIVVKSKRGESHEMYLSLLMDAIQGSSDEFRRVALAEIRTNPSAVDVAPDLVSIVTQTVEQRLHFAGSHVCRALRILLAMLNNSLLYLGPFAPSLVQLLTNMVLEPHPSWPPAKEKISHTHLSQLASVCIAELIRKYADGVNKMRSILHDTLTLTLTQPDPHLHLVTLTGTVQIVSFLGPQSISEVLLSRMEGLVELVHHSSENDTSRNTALRLYNALLDSAIVLLVNEESTVHEGHVNDPMTANYDQMCDLFGESLLMALEAQASRITTTRKLGRESSELSSSGVPTAATPVGGEMRSFERYPVGGFNRTARRVPVTKAYGRVFFPVYRKSIPEASAVNVLECSIKRHKSLDISRAVVQKGKQKKSKQNSAIKITSLPLGSLTL